MKTGYRPLIVGGLVGLVLVAASLTGSGWLLNIRAGNGSSAGGKSDSVPAATGRSVVCIGYVDVEHGITSLYPVQTGRVEKIFFRENQPVDKGKIILSLDKRSAQNMVTQAEADLAAASAQCEQARKKIDQQKLREAQQQAAIEAVKQKQIAAEAIMARREELQNVQGSMREVEAARALVAELKAVLLAEEKKLEELKLNDPQLDIRRAEADVRAKEGQLAQAKLALEECDLKAPMDGTVLRVLATEGETLGSNPRQAAVLFCPRGVRIVRAEVEQEFARRVAIDQIASIQDDTISGDRWTGKVARLSDWFTHRRSIIQEPLQFNDVRTMECIVTVDPNQPPLKIGQRVRVVLQGKE